MGSLASGIAGLVMGDPTKGEQNQLGDLGAYTSNTGEGATDEANKYYSGLLSGDPAQIAKTLAPEIKASQDQTQQTKQTNAEFGNRSGGTNSSSQAADTQGRGDIISLIGQAQQGAAAGEAGLGTNLLSQGTTNINDQANLASKAQQSELGDIGGIAQGVGGIIEANPGDIFSALNEGSSSPGGATASQTTTFGDGSTFSSGM